MDSNFFEQFKFEHEFRKHQKMIFEKFEDMNGKRDGFFKYHVIAPPGSGKTIAGIEMAARLGKPVLVMCPNTAIQGQWIDKLKMFVDEGKINLNEIASISSKEIKLFNVFTYQALSIPDNGDESFVSMSENAWAEYLSTSQGIAIEEALEHVYKMKESNRTAYRSELAKFNKKLRNGALKDTNVEFFKILHQNAQELITKMAQVGVKTVIFDECHHLQNYWSLVMAEVVRKLEAENLIGLTATPPLSDDKEKIECYTALLGEIDFQIPTPAVVKENMLAPYQDLVYFCMPNEDELKFIEDSHERFKELVYKFNNSNCDFYFWIIDRIIERKLITGEKQDWTKFISSRSKFAAAGVKYLMKNGYKIPWDITVTEEMYEEINLEDWCSLIEDYALNLLKVSSKDQDSCTYEEIRQALRNLGLILSEQGIRGYSSPIDRILAYSKSKLEALKIILKSEMSSLGEKIRIAIITDFEYSNALSLKKMENIIDEESGGAVSIIRELVCDVDTDKLNPVMVTSNHLLCDDDLAPIYVELGLKWAKENKLDIMLSIEPTSTGAFVSILGSGRDWSSRTAVLLTTHLLEQGITKCIIGTRGLLGEGWDSINLNTLIDLSTVTTYASVNQLRGRSIRKSEQDSMKLSNNWDIICIALGLEKGYNDVDRLYRKHSQFYGICDDGQIELGVNHLDASLVLSDEKLKTEELKNVNERMLRKSKDREKAYKMWKIGESYDNTELGCCELKLLKPIEMKDASVYRSERSEFNKKFAGSILQVVGSVTALSIACVTAVTTEPIAVTAFVVSGFLGYNSYNSFKNLMKYGKEKFLSFSMDKSISDIATCVFCALKECKYIEQDISEDKIIVADRSDGSLRVYLDASAGASAIFSRALTQLLSPIEDQRYAIERYEVHAPKSVLGKYLYLFRFSGNWYNSVLACYHPLPEYFNLKAKALVFQKYWNKYVSPGNVVYLKGEGGQKVIENYGRVNFLGAKKHATTVWQ